MRITYLKRLLLVMLVSFFSYLPFAHSGDMLKMVVIEVDSLQSVNQLQKLVLDITAIRNRTSGKIHDGKSDTGPFDVETVITDADSRILKKHGFNWRDFVPKAAPAPKASTKVLPLQRMSNLSITASMSPVWESKTSWRK